jgi:hypothetical protein
MSDLTKRRPKTLAQMLEARQALRDKAFETLLPLALDHNERIGDMCERLRALGGSEIRAYDLHQAKIEEIYQEAERRYGPAVTFRSMWGTFLATVRP